MAATGFRHARRSIVPIITLFIGLFVLVAPTSSAATSSASPSPTSSATAALTQVTAVAPTGKTVGCGGLDNLFTIPQTAGVQYLVNGAVLEPNDYLVSDYSTSTSLTVTARATSGYVLAGQSSWTLTVPAPECVAPTVTTKCGSFTVTNHASYAIGFDWRRPGAAASEGYYPSLAPGASTTITTKSSSLDFSYAPADDGMQFSIEPISVPQDCATPQPTSTGSTTPAPTASTTSATGSATTTGPVIVTDGGSGEGGNGTLAAGSIACALGAGLVGFGLRRRLRR